MSLRDEIVETLPINPDGPEAAAEIERLQRELKRMFLSWHAADMQAGENWAKLKLAREGLGPISRMHILPDSAMNIATLNAAVRIATQTLKDIGGDE